MPLKLSYSASTVWRLHCSSFTLFCFLIIKRIKENSVHFYTDSRKTFNGDMEETWYVSVLQSVLHQMLIAGNTMENEDFKFKNGEKLKQYLFPTHFIHA